MSEVKSGDTVRIHYTGTLADGSQFDSSSGRDPLEFTIGAGSVIPGFEQAIIGMAVGDSKSVTIACADAYGPHDAELIREVEREAIPDSIELAVGLQLQAQGPDNSQLVLTVVEFDEETVRLDANHPLAGKDLTFALELVEIV